MNNNTNQRFLATLAAALQQDCERKIVDISRDENGRICQITAADQRGWQLFARSLMR